ncbi:MAG: CDP-diacylglycerol--serine O-phosphatidyltransferase [Thermodesulfobacteriaceae bacterium]|nr:CDP-diacylglycerol--serine O-phosphatidyltransferase [Thermodesulfobacteriaceae bacterium]MCX8041593.1 CDP-diacylglycerol--serine O-phosphatidyltransferase [Thermodesulfobacteriaceae bacterium]MDW8136555.1 CDP-diacylglycerol--serine O-phosphatidyltransferase [Thermodesulfobacterium sp.]
MLFLIPHIFTTLNLFCGFYALVAVLDENYWAASWAILLAMIFDIFDGRIARFLGKTSKFGLEYDSLADLVSFGVAPALLIYNFSLKGFGRIGWLAGFLYTSCVALRLARFNVKSTIPSLSFEGLPSPAGGCILATLVIFLIHLGTTPVYKNWLLLILVYALAYLLVSPIQYPNFKSLKIEKKQTFYLLVFFVLALTVVASYPYFSLLSIVSFYVLLGPALLFIKYSKKLVQRKFKNKKKISQEKLTKKEF